MHVKESWHEYHKRGFNLIPVGHYIIPQLMLDAQTFPDARQRLAAILNCPEEEVVSALRSFLKTPTFSETLRKFISDLQGNGQVAGKGSKIPSLATVANIRTANSKNSYQPFYEKQIDDETAERMINAYAPIASGIAVLLGQVSNLMALDFDSTETLIRFLQDMGFSANEENLEEILQIAFPQNPIVRTWRGYHVWSAYDAEIAKILSGKSYEEKVGGYDGFEIRCHHSYIVVPPSACGVANGVIRRYEFIRPLDASNRNAQLPAWFYFWLKDTYKSQTQTQVMLSTAPTPSSVKEVVVNSLTPYWRKGHRQKLCYTLSGVMRRAALPLHEAREIIQTICELASDEQISHRLYTVEYEFKLPLTGNQRCAGISAFRQEAIAAGVPEEVVQTVIRALFGVRMSADFTEYLQDYDALGKKVAALLQNDFCYNMRYMDWFRFDLERLEWVETDESDILVFVNEAVRQVHDEFEEIIKLHNNGTIPKNYRASLNRLLNQTFIRQTLMTVIRSELKVMHEFPYIPQDYIPSEFQDLKLLRITFHRNGCLLWFDRGETYFISNNDTFITQREFYATKTLPSEVKEDADMSPFVDYLAEVMGGKDNAEYFLKVVSAVLATQRNIYRKAIIFVGGGQNGKNSTIDIIKAALGDLVQQTPSAAIIKSSETVNLASLYKLKGSAIAYIDETPDKNWNSDIFKAVTGAWSIVAKRYYKDPEDMPITFILLILTNHLPKEFDRQSQALEDRFVVINFPHRYADIPHETEWVKRRNPAKVAALMENTPAVIAAFRHYYKLAAQEGFIHELPPAVLEETNEIRIRANSVGFFLQNCIIDDPTSSILVTEMYDYYKRWCRINEAKPVRDRDFREYLKRANFKLERTGRGYLCHCVKLNTEFLNDNNNEPAPTPSLLASDNGSNDEGNAAVADNGDEQDYLDEFPF
jgi:P4 family phage/plasmid primase-like protien